MSDITSFRGSERWLTRDPNRDAIADMESIKTTLTRRLAAGTTRLFTCLALVAAITWVAFSLLRVNSLTAGLSYVLVVLVVAAKWGMAESFVTSVAAMLCLNFFFLPPILSLTIYDPQNWVALFVFLVVAVTASTLSSSARQRANEAQARRIEVERLYQLSRSLMLVDTTRDLRVQIAAQVKELFGFAQVAYCDGLTGELSMTDPSDARFEQQVLRDVAVGEATWFVWRKTLTPVSIALFIAPVSLGGKVVGSLGAIGPALSEPALQGIANVVGISIERARQQLAVSKIEAARQNEHLRGIFLDALAHDFATPLTSIKGAITTVRSEYGHEPEEEELLAVAEEEAEKLGEMIEEAVDMARIEPGKPRIRRCQLPILKLVRSSVDRMKSLLDGRPLEIQIQEDSLSANADPDMIGLALRQLLGNAVKYSPPGSTIMISANQINDTVTVRVSDQGPGIPQNELESIFERFYRGSRVRDLVPGTGMGLSVARDIINAHQGRLWVENRPEGGTQFSFSLPIFSEDKEP
jgi:two-component system sensor histidine kinase KdpD